MAELTKEAACKEIAEQMGNAGYCNYDACLEFVREAYDAGANGERERIKSDPGTQLLGHSLMEIQRALCLAEEKNSLQIYQQGYDAGAKAQREQEGEAVKLWLQIMAVAIYGLFFMGLMISCGAAWLSGPVTW